MFEKLARTLEGFAADRAPRFDPSSLEDPIAMKTGWSPLKAGGTNFRTHALVAVAFDRMEFRSTTGTQLFCLLFLLVGLGVLVASLVSRQFLLMLAGLVFTGAGGFLLHQFAAPAVFDKRSGAFWRGRKAPVNPYASSDGKRFARLKEIHALQLLREHVRGKSSYYSYELNVVLKDGKRINVVDHGNQSSLQDEASTLAAFLGTPVWDAS